MSKFKIGDKAWSIVNPFYELEEVEIISEQQETSGIFYYTVHGIDTSCTFSVVEEYLFHTQEEALAESHRRNELEIEEIVSAINSTEDLLRMMIDCMYNETREDCNYIEAAKRKAKELLGVEL